jgi:hypothetical protein
LAIQVPSVSERMGSCTDAKQKDIIIISLPIMELSILIRAGRPSRIASCGGFKNGLLGHKEVDRRVLIEDIKKHILLDSYIITFHAHIRMDERGISTEDLVNLILDGRVIEDYPDSKPCPSALIAGIARWRCCHDVVALCENHLRIVTVYWPEDGEWTNNMTKRKS